MNFQHDAQVTSMQQKITKYERMRKTKGLICNNKTLREINVRISYISEFFIRNEIRLLELGQ